MRLARPARALLLALAAFAAPPAAAKPPPPAPEAARPRAPGAARGEGAPFRSNGQDYRLVGSVRAVPIRPREGRDEALAKVGAPPAAFLATKGRFVLYEDAAAAPAAELDAGGARTLPVAVNVRTSRLAVVLNSLVVRLQDPAAAPALAREHGLELVRSAPRLRRAFLRAPPGADLRAALAAVAADPRVLEAELEVQDRVPVAR